MRNLFQNILLILIVSGTSCNIYAQEPAYRNYTNIDGLANNNVYSITQDKQGFIWFATDNGVSRFDGSKFKNFSMADGLSDNSVLHVAEDNKGRLWFLTFNGKLSFYNNGKIYNASNNELLRKIKFTNAINNFFQDTNKNIWISCVDRRIVKISNSDQITTYHEMDSHEMESRGIMEDKHGTIYSFTTKGLFTYKKGRFIYKEIGIHLQGCIMLPGDSTVLLDAPDGIATYDLNKNLYSYNLIGKNYKAANILGMFMDKNKNLWISSLNGVTEFDKGIISEEHEHHFFKNYSITTVFIDRDNNIWFSSIGSGVFMVPSLHVRLFDSKSGLIENNISSLAYIANDLLMVGTHNGSIQIIDHNNIKENNQSLIVPAGSIIKIIKDSNGDAWVLTSVALFKYHEGKFKIFDSPSWNKTIYQSKDGSIWIGWGRGLRKIVNDDVKNVFADTTVNRIYAIEEINNDLFLGSDKGLYRYHNGEMIFEGKNDTLLKHRINSLAATNDSILWIATDAYGLLSINHNIVKSYSINDHLLSNHCNNLLADSNKVYLCTDKGLNVISKKDNKIQIVSYSAANGLISSNINQIIKKEKNTFLLATDRGIIEFNEAMLPRPIEGSPYIGDVVVNDVSIPFFPFYTFKYNENNIQIGFGSINFNRVGDPVYRYKLSGLDSGWNYTTSNSIKYSSLKSGNYSFIIALQNTNGTWSSKTSSIRFIIATPWWKTWWFIALMALAILVIIILVTKWRLGIYKQRLDLQKLFAESELKALRSQINPHFIYNSLNSIQDFIMQNQKEDANLYLAKFAKLMRNILSHSRTSKITLTQEIESLGLYLELESLRFNNQFAFNFIVGNGINPEEVEIPSMILQPYVENAVLHGLASKEHDGIINIDFAKKDNFLICSIEDNGIGRKKSQELKSRKLWRTDISLGMKITRERIDLLSTQEKQKISLEIRDIMDEKNNPSGTRVILYFPYIKK